MKHCLLYTSLVEGIDQAFFGKLENNTETLNQLLMELEAEND